MSLALLITIHVVHFITANIFSKKNTAVAIKYISQWYEWYSIERRPPKSNGRGFKSSQELCFSTFLPFSNFNHYGVEFPKSGPSRRGAITSMLALKMKS